MTTTVFNEPIRAGEFLVSEANGNRSRDVGALLTGTKYIAGTVLGQITHGTASVVAGTNTGNGVFGAVTVGATAQAGDYKVRITKAAANAGDFQVVDPQGDVVGLGTVAVAFAGGGLAFTLADGATDFAVGDSWTVTVAAGSLKFKTWNPTNTDGSQVAVAVLVGPVDATDADQRATIIARSAEVNAHSLTYVGGATDNQKAAAATQLAAVGIIVRL